MSFQSKGIMFAAAAGVVGFLLCAGPGSIQAQSKGNSPSAADQKPLMAEDVFKNVQVLRGISANEFLETMGFFAASLDANCTHCHELGTWESYAKDNEPKLMARKMVVMMNSINQSYFGGRQVLTCYSCHRFGQKPEVVPDLEVQYSSPPDKAPTEILAQVPGQPTPDQVLDKYFQALGGAQKLAGIKSVVAQGTWQGYEDTEQHPFQLYAQAPAQRTTIVDNRGALTTNTYDGRNGWVAAPYTDVPVTLVTLIGSDLENARVDAELALPGRIKEALTDWKVGRPFTIDDRDVTVLQGYNAAKSPVQLYFDSETGLLVRMVRYTSLKVGRLPTQFDYSDYREVDGVKIPFHWVTTWTDGRSKTQLTTVKLNAPIDPAKFAKPAAPPSQ